MGRKKGQEWPMPKKTCLLQVRMVPEEKKELQERLGKSGIELSSYIRCLIELDKKEGYICRH